MKTGNKRRRGFTLIELAIVVAILGAIMAIIISSINVGDIKDDTASMELRKEGREIQMHLERYAQKFGNYPSEEQGLEALVEKPTTGDVPEDWRPMASNKDIIKDPWGTPYKLKFNEYGEMQIITLGKDRQEGGEGVNADFNILKEEDYPSQFKKK
ncbi:type II secretion system protein GspG [Leptospira fluminis]|uniref:Type II secretion system protein GspG n=2 Tax=Leptospira TaxID=171 RepID=A0A4R9GPL3_9LEPT|nr:MULTISPECIES: type II secretion system major pseudopilin GspG [Leptospira]TGK08686.1 type II secretion system protein GspG [Leptospira fletcheri]TGK18910.1 type II secretion system protein GspG [Leptospira fluminis]